MKPIVFSLMLSLIFVCGCQNSDEGSPASPPQQRQAPPAKAISQQPSAPLKALATQRLLMAPMTPQLVELPTAALSTWRTFQAQKPVLILLSQDPLLAPVPAELREEVSQLILGASPEQIDAGTDTTGPNPLLLPSMAVDAALEADLFSRVVWVLPSKSGADQLDLSLFQQQLLDLGAVDEAEATSFATTAPGVFSGMVRSTPFQAVHLDALPALDEPVVLHIDVSYFAPLYQGEIKTPLYPLLGRIHGTLRDTQWQVLGVTISSANLDGGIPLASRFLTNDIARLYREPDLLDAPLPKSWDLRARALYLENFFKKEEVRKLYEDMEAEAPEDPSIKYALYQVLRQFKEGDHALVKLNQAVALDPVYALEYLELANVAKEQNLADQVQRMLMLAVAAQPENVWLQLQLVGQLKANGQEEEADKLLTTLREQPWSPVYYPEMVKPLE